MLIVFFLMQFFAIGLLFGNLRSLAMQPLGHIAGIGAAITGFVSTLMSVPISTFIGGFVDDNSRDNYAINVCTHFIATDFNSNEKRTSGTQKNIELCKTLGKIKIDE